MSVAQLGVGDTDELLAAILRSRELHRPWVAPPDDREALAEYLGEGPATRISYGVRHSSGALAGVINISNIVRGAFKSAYLGYYALSPYEGAGLMHAGLGEVIDLAFGHHDLHRLEANIQPANARSQGLVRELGFRLEGHSPRYLFVDGAWRDHDRFAITREEWDWQPRPSTEAST